MKKIIIAFGIVIILFGLILAAYSQKTNIIQNSTWTETMKEWTSSMGFNQSEIIGFSFRPDNDWSIFAYDMHYVNVSGNQMPAKYFEVNVTGPQSNYTMVRILLIITLLNGGASKISVYPGYYDVYNKTGVEFPDWARMNTTSGFQDPAGAILIEKGFPKADTIRGDVVFQLGKTPVAGRYNVSCSLDPEIVRDELPNGTAWLHPVSPPAVLRIYETTTSTDYPYSLLLPAGIPASIIGVITTLWGAKDKKKIKHP